MSRPDNRPGSHNEFADEDKLFVCMACGKTSLSRYGFREEGEGLLKKTVRDSISPGWDESCMLNCAEFPQDKLVYSGGLVIEVKK